MGLKLGDTISFGEGRSLALSFAPRGASTDGPVAFMHRASARDNPDAPLGHHVGQDVGHISSTVLAASLALGAFGAEASAFNGDEPQPTHVDLPLGPVNSGALRLSYALRPGHRIAASIARVHQQDELFPGSRTAMRAGASVQNRWTMGRGTLDHSLIFGSIARAPVGVTLHSLLDEGTFARGAQDWWWRAELLQRLPMELALPIGATPGANDARWVSALTVGYTHWLRPGEMVQAALGCAVTVDSLPRAWANAYGSATPLTTRLIFQARISLPRRAP
jgi:hypothetical protein